ncbi:unnamed protein product [Mytilus edulis]|uniref:Uncharacterized protein n=1 Tax=Mytilus edulis TaxID=6550 RepID=A0A8S3Q0C5_MYTED|nr:unnamed protein product [Mytilus edulis]
MRIGFDEEVVPIVLKIFNCENDLKSVLIEVLGGIGEYFGIYSDLSIDLNKVLTGQKPTRDIPSLILEIFLQVAKSVQAKPELIEAMETLQSLTNISKKQTDSNMILDKLRQFIPILADELAIHPNIIARLVGMRYPFKLSDVSSILIEFLAMKAGLSQDIVQAVQVYMFKGEINQLCRWICGQSKIDKTLISSILKSLLNEKTILKGIMKIPVCITQHYDFSTESVSFLQSLMDGKKPNCDKIQLFLPLIKDGCKLFFGKTTNDIVDTFFAIMETPDWLERVFLSLVEHLAVKLGINKLVLITLANALTNGGSPKQIFKNLARIAGVPSSAVDIIFEVMKQQGLKSKTGLSPLLYKTN